MKGGKITVDEPITFGPKFKANTNQPKGFLQAQNKYLQKFSLLITDLIPIFNWYEKDEPNIINGMKKTVNGMVGLQINYLANVVNYVEAKPTAGGRRKKQRSRSKHR